MGIDAEGKCSKCGGEDFTPAGTCRACKRASNQAQARKKAAGGGSVKKAKKAPTPKREKLKSEELVMPAAWGIKAHLEDGFLQIEQSDAEGHTDTVMLSRSEFSALIDRYGVWAGE